VRSLYETDNNYAEGVYRYMADKYEDEILEGEVSDDDDQEENKKEPEKYCTLCHRAESQVGKMIDLPNNIHICPDCMQRSFDSMNQHAEWQF
jgi:ATP-dependent Clp protease ATP-binding subunit ClpX